MPSLVRKIKARRRDANVKGANHQLRARQMSADNRADIDK